MKKGCLGILMAALVLLSAAGCGGSKSASGANAADLAAEITEESKEYGYDTAASSEMAVLEDEEAAGSAPTGESPTSAQEGGLDHMAQNGRKLIRTVRLEMQTRGFDDLTEGLARKVQEMGGYIESSSMWGGGYAYGGGGDRSAEYTVRIPSKRLDEFLDIVSGLGTVTYRNESVDDVTLQYVDTESRKKALETEQERLLELLEKAENLEDLLTIESKLSEVRYELENYGSQLRLLDNQIDYSTVYINVSEVERITETEKKGFLGEIADRFNDSLYRVGMGLRGFTVGFIGSLPILAVWAAVIAAIVLILRRIYRKPGGSSRFGRKKEQQRDIPPTDEKE